LTTILRPSFTQRLDMPIGEAASRLDTVRTIGGEPVVVEVAGWGRHRIIALHPTLRRFWSPWAHLDLREDDEAEHAGASCIAVLRFSPNPPLWFAIMLTYLALATIAFLALCWGAAQLTLGRTPRALWIIPATLVIALAIALAARIGQRLAHEQMLMVRAALRQALGIDPDPNADPDTDPDADPENA
jgi:hypothetical protein